jgi:hypothetical protein
MDEQSKPSIVQRIARFIRSYFTLLLVLLLIVVLVGAFFGGRESVYRAHPELSAADQASAILEKVGTLILLPANEAPTMATINDAEVAKKAQPFLANVVNGDVLIIYAQAQMAIVYRPSTDKLIAVGPVDVGAAQNTQGQIPVQTTPPATNNATNTSED